MEYGGMTGRARAAVLAVLIVFAACAAAPAADGDTNRLTLNADRISYEEATGVAIAEGAARMSNQEISLYSPYIEYDDTKKQITAFSTPDGSVTLVSAGRRLSGEKLDYNLTTRRGVLTHPNGKMDALYIKGDAIEVMPVSDTAYGKRYLKPEEEDELAGRWLGAAVTTCVKPAPHYRLESKEVTVIPDRQIVIKSPKVYLGRNMLFKYPFDYVAPLSEEERRRYRGVFPKIGYESSKGLGIGFGGPVTWQGGSLALEAIAWTEGIWEGGAQVEQELTAGLTAYGGVMRKYDKDRDVTLLRPSWGLEQQYAGWFANVRWSQRELLNVEKIAGRDTRYVVWRHPELNIVSPWVDDPAAGGRYRMFASWGRYEDVTGGHSPTIERSGAGVQTAGELSPVSGSKADIRPFYNAVYWYYHYDADSSSKQQILDAAAGAKWRAGDFKMETAYLRRWQWGNSPMLWDDYEEREEVYQSATIKLPTKALDEWWELGIRAAYSIDRDELAEMVYRVAYELDCSIWELIYRDDRSKDDDWVGLRLTIKAFPDNGLRLAGDDLFEPSKAPDKLVPVSLRDK